MIPSIVHLSPPCGDKWMLSSNCKTTGRAYGIRSSMIRAVMSKPVLQQASPPVYLWRQDWYVQPHPTYKPSKLIVCTGLSYRRSLPGNGKYRVARCHCADSSRRRGGERVVRHGNGQRLGLLPEHQDHANAVWTSSGDAGSR